MATGPLIFELRCLVRSEHEADESFTGWRQFNDDLHLVHTLEGCGGLRVLGRRYAATPNVVLAVPAHTLCSWEKRMGSCWRMLNFHCRLWLSPGREAQQELALPVSFAPAGLEAIHGRLREADGWQREAGPGTGARVAAVVLDVLSGYLRDHGQPVSSNRADELMQELRKRIDARITEPFDAGLLASSVNLSVSQMNRRFRAAFGVAPKAYRQARRLAAAEAMLRDRGDRLAQIAAELGFLDVYHFARWFRSRIGIPPGLYRRRSRRLRV